MTCFDKIQASILQSFFLKNLKQHTPKPTKQQAHKPQPHKPTNHFPKTLARRNARKRSAAPPARGEPGVLDSRLGCCRVLPDPKFPSPKFQALDAGPRILAKPGGVLTPPYLPGGPAHSARPRTFAPVGRPGVELFEFLVDFCTSQKSSKNRIPQNTAKKYSKSTFGAPWPPKIAF